MNGRETVPYDVGYWNGGQRPPLALIDAWSTLLDGTAEGAERPLVALHVSEVADQVSTLKAMIKRGNYGLILGPDGVPDGRKEAILYDRDRLRPFTPSPRLRKIGDAFMGRRAGHPGTRRMANKYVLEQEFADLTSGWTPTHGVTHIWPSVKLNQDHVIPLVREAAAWCEDTAGSLFLTMDANMDARHGFMSPLRNVELTNSQITFGPARTWIVDKPDHFDVAEAAQREPDGGADVGGAIDMILARESRHYQMTGQTTIRLPGHEHGGKPGHKAVIAHGRMTVRKRQTRLS